MMKTISVSKVVSIDLAMRESADRFFNQVESLPEEDVTIDFKDVKSISRSFAHQYVQRLKHSSKSITETNVPDNVRKMFRIVEEVKTKPRLVDLRTIRIVSL